jgi:hypothetical protein
MKISKDSVTITLGILLPISVYIFLGILLAGDNNDSPRSLKGIDTIESGDSTYVIKFKIDTVFETPDNEDY